MHTLPKPATLYVTVAEPIAYRVLLDYGWRNERDPLRGGNLFVLYAMADNGTDGYAVTNGVSLHRSADGSRFVLIGAERDVNRVLDKVGVRNY